MHSGIAVHQLPNGLLLHGRRENGSGTSVKERDTA